MVAPATEEIAGADQRGARRGVSEIRHPAPGSTGRGFVPDVSPQFQVHPPVGGGRRAGREGHAGQERTAESRTAELARPPGGDEILLILEKPSEQIRSPVGTIHRVGAEGNKTGLKSPVGSRRRALGRPGAARRRFRPVRRGIGWLRRQSRGRERDAHDHGGKADPSCHWSSSHLSSI